METDQIIQLVIFGIFVVLKMAFDAFKKKPQAPAPAPDDFDDELEDDELEDQWPESAGGPDLDDEMDLEVLLGSGREPEPGIGAAEAARRRFLAAADTLAASADEQWASAHLTLATRQVATVLEEYVAPQLRALRREVEVAPEPDESVWTRLNGLETIIAVVETLVNQRRQPVLGRALGDADAMAMACYQPIFDFTLARRVPLTSATPVTLLTPFDLAIWTGFVPTGIAPLFLPRDFFDRLAWWPALAHEIGHDFLVATGDATERLRDQLGLVSAEVGRRPILLTAQGIALRDIERVFGGWFEELFADVFGTMMVGPAYGYSMLEIFSAPGYPLGTAVMVDASGTGYDPHPPRHLRVLLCAHVLEQCDEAAAADELRDAWRERTGEVDAIRFPVAPTGAIGVPIEPIMEIATAIADTLRSSPLLAFDSYSLYDIPGVGWGPHEKAGSRRARDELLAGRPPVAESARAVITGAVLARRQAPERERELCALARRAIVGVTEHREDAYRQGWRVAAIQPGAAWNSPDGLREALVLHTLLAAPPSLRGRGGGGGPISRPAPGPRAAKSGVIAGGGWQRRWG